MHASRFVLDVLGLVCLAQIFGDVRVLRCRGGILPEMLFSAVLLGIGAVCVFGGWTMISLNQHGLAVAARWLRP